MKTTKMPGSSPKPTDTSAGSRASRKKQSKRTKYIVLLMLAVVLAVVLAMRISTNNAQTAGIEEQADTRLEKLYTQALKDEKQGRFADAAGRFKQIEEIKPGYKDAKERLTETIGQAVAELEQEIEDGNLEDVGDDLQQLQKIAPDDPEVEQLVQEAEQNTASNGNPNNTNSSPGTDPTQNDQPGNGDPDPGSSRLKDEDLTAVDIVPSTLADYSTENIWDANPLAGGAYKPGEPPMQTTADVVLLTVGRLGAEEAQARLEEERENFDEEQTEVSINGTFTGEAGMSGGILAVTWVYDDWFFTVQVVPKSSASRDTLIEAAMNFTAELDL